MTLDSDTLRQAPPSRWSVAWAGWPGRLARILFALLPLVWLTRKVSWHDVLHRAYGVGAPALLGSLAVGFCSLVIGSVRWRVMLRAYGASSPPGMWTLLRHNLVGGYFNILPSGVAGDAVRGHRVRRYVPSVATSYTVILVERLTGLVGLLLIAGGALLAGSELRGGAVAWTLNVGILGALGLSLLALVLPYLVARHPGLRETVARLPLVGGLLVRVPPARSLLGPLLAVGLSVLTQGAMVLCVALIIYPLAPVASLVVCARVVPAIILFTYIPLTPGGLGQREAAFVYLFGLAHVAADAAVATSLLFFAVLLTLASLGGLCLLAERVLKLPD